METDSRTDMGQGQGVKNILHRERIHMGEIIEMRPKQTVEQG